MMENNQVEPKVGDTRRDAKWREQTWMLCPECKQGFWNRNYTKCITCFNKPGSEYVIRERGIVYIKLAETDPYYAMTAKHFGMFGAGWTPKARYVMAQALGHCLTEEERVVNKQKDKSDIRIENLSLRKCKPRTRHSDVWDEDEVDIQLEEPATQVEKPTARREVDTEREKFWKKHSKVLPPN